MSPVFAYSTLALTVTLAVSQPRIGHRDTRITPGLAALLGVALLLGAGILAPADLVVSMRVQWRPMLALASIMVMTGVVRETGAFERLAAWVERYAQSRTPAAVFRLVFFISVITPTLLNNDSAILLLTPLVVALAKRLYPAHPTRWEAFAFAVFLAPGVAPFVISNPMNMIVAEYAGLSFNDYSRIMAPISMAGALLTFIVLRLVYAKALALSEGTGPSTPLAALPPSSLAHPAQGAAIALLIGVFLAYPIMSAIGGPIWAVSLSGAIASLALAWKARVAPLSRIASHVSPDILMFLWGTFLVVTGLSHVGVVDRLAHLYAQGSDSASRTIGVVGTMSALGSAIVDNHPMALLNMMALANSKQTTTILAALIGGDLGPRLLPIGSLAGLLWLDLARRGGISISSGRFLRVGLCVLVPTLALSLAMLATQAVP